MQKHPRITLDRIKRLLEELHSQLYPDQVPLQVEILHSIEPLDYAVAAAGAFQAVSLPYQWGPRWSTLWLRLSGVWPEQWAGGYVVALVDTGSEALVWDTLAGEAAPAPAQGLDANRRDYLLHAHAPAGLSQVQRTVQLYVEAVANDAFGYGESFTLKQAALARRDTARWELWHDLRVLYDIALQLDEDSARRAQLIRIMNAAVNAYRQLHGGLDAGEAMAQARQVLREAYSAPAAASASDICALGHSHIDTAWLWPIRETIRKCSRTFSTVLKYMERYPEYRYVQSQPQLYAFTKEHYPALYARIKQAVATGTWEPQGAMWVEADCNVPSGESFVRQMLYGMRFFKEEFGCGQDVLWLPDVFGYSAALPQIMAQCGIRYFMTQKISWNQTNKFPHHTFWWEGIDGTRVLAHFPPADTYCGDMSAKELLRGERQYQEHGRAPGWLYLFGYGDGGGGVTQEMLEAARRMHDVEGLPRVQQKLARDWFPELESRVNDLQTWSGELYLEYHRGTLTTQARNKQGNRYSELLLRDAEFLSAIASSCSSSFAYPAAELEQAWKLVLLNQFHDILPGSSIKWVYQDSARDYAQITALGTSMRDAALQALAAGGAPAAGEADCLQVWNTLSFARDEIISLPAAQLPEMSTEVQPGSEFGQPTALIRSGMVPACGFACAPAAQHAAGAMHLPATADGMLLDNGVLRAEFNTLGELTRLYDLEAQRDVLPEGEPANALQLFDDRPVNWDAWDVDPYYEEVRLEPGREATCTLIERGPLRAALRIERSLALHSRMVQEIRLCSGSRRLDFATWIDWHEEHVLLKVAFPVAMHAPHAAYEIQFGFAERPVHRNTSWDWARFEVPAQRWADLSETGYGVALLNDCKYGYDCHGHVLRLSLLRAPKSPDPDADMGEHRFCYSLLPHRGDLVAGGVVREALALNSPLLARAAHAPSAARSYFSMDSAHLVLDTVKQAEDGGGLIVRLYETHRSRGTARLQFDLPYSTAQRCNLLEEAQAAVEVRSGVIEFDFKPFEIITFKLS